MVAVLGAFGVEVKLSLVETHGLRLLLLREGDLEDGGVLGGGEGGGTGGGEEELAFGEALGDTTALPPYKQFFGGGPESIRGYRESYMGPRDSFGNPYGGNVLVASQLELIIPIPDKFSSQARASLFYDVGNVFNTGEVEFTDKLGSPVTYKPDLDELRTSVGIAVQWLAPLGMFRFSYALPLNEYEGNDRFYGDEVERFQFSIGNAF